MTDHAKELDHLADNNYCLDHYEGGTYYPIGQMLKNAAAEIRRLQDIEKRYEFLRKLNAAQFAILYVRCYKEDLNFDDFVLKLANGEAVL